MKTNRKWLGINQARYIVVEVADIIRESYFDGHKFTDIETTKEIFDEKNIPVEFQKIVICVNPLFKFNSVHDYYEYTLGFPFDINIVSDELNKYIVGKSKTNNIYNNLRMNNKISFETSFHVYSEEVVNSFFEKLNENGYLESYLECIKDMFWKLSFKNILNNKINNDKKMKIKMK